MRSSRRAASTATTRWSCGRELSDAQKVVEPRNADSHLTFIGAGHAQLRHLPHAPGRAGLLHRARRQERRAAARSARPPCVAYDQERVVARDVGRDSGVEAPDRFGQPRRSAARPARAGQRAARAQPASSTAASTWSLDPSERNVGLTVNEYETLLMQHDLVDVLRDPLRFARIKAGNMLDDPLRDPGQDAELRQVRRRPRAEFADGSAAAGPVVVRAAGGQGDVGAGAPVPALAARQLPGRLATRSNGAARSLRGTYQSPILVQWQPAERQERHLDIVVVQLS